MVKTIDFTAYYPQQVFLVQGDHLFAETLANTSLNPTTQLLSVPRFTTDHARTIATFAVEGTGEERFFVIFFAVFSPEAAQVLLKSLEEPAAQTTIVFVTPYPYLVPQTVRSRVMLISDVDWRESPGKTKKSILEEIAKEAAEKEEDAAVRRSRALILLDDLEYFVKDQPYEATILYRAKKMLFKANLPTKFVLDYVATVLA
jgi:DNA polymerase III delta prime subunit